LDFKQNSMSVDANERGVGFWQKPDCSHPSIACTDSNLLYRRLKKGPQHLHPACSAFHEGQWRERSNDAAIAWCKHC
jgi:hypothetical protein